MFFKLNKIKLMELTVSCFFFFFYIQEKEKETKRLPLVSSTPWSSLLIALSRLALAEKTYFSLPFIAKKFFRKDVNIYYI